MSDNEKQYNKPKYSFIAQLLHWSFVVLFAYGIFKQVDNINQLEEISFLKGPNSSW